MPSRTDVYIAQNTKDSERICMAVRAVFAVVEKWFWVRNEWHRKVKKRERAAKQQLQRPCFNGRVDGRKGKFTTISLLPHSAYVFLLKTETVHS
jgi:hypothetical protein